MKRKKKTEKKDTVKKGTAENDKALKQLGLF